MTASHPPPATDSVPSSHLGCIRSSDPVAYRVGTLDYCSQSASSAVALVAYSCRPSILGSHCRGPAPTASASLAPTTLRKLEAAGRGHRPLRQRGGHHRRGERRRDHAAADRRPRDSAAGRSAGVHPRHDRHPAQRRRQGEPVFPARLQPRPRHRLRHLRRRHAGEHAHARARPGLHRSQLPDPGTGLAHRLLQGPVLRRPRAISRPRAAPTSATSAR